MHEGPVARLQTPEPSADAESGSIALDAVPVLIWVSGADKAGIYFNRTWLDFTGRTLEEERGEGWVAGVHPDDAPALEACSTAFDRRVPFQIEFRLRRHDGVWRWMLDKAAPRFSPEGQFLGFMGCCIDITRRKETEAALRASQERLQLAQEAAAVGTYDWDLTTGRITWSPEMFRLHGIDPTTPPERIYSEWLARLHPEDRERADEETRGFVANEDHLSIEFRVIHPDGGLRWINGRGRMFRDHDGQPVRMIGVNFDVTERRVAEEALRASEQRLRDIAENFPGIIFRRVSYPDGRIEYPYFSGADEAVFHMSRERLQQARTIEDVSRLIHYDDVDEMVSRFKRAAAELTSLEVEGRVVSEDGALRWIRSISRPRPRNDGALVWDGVMLDVTEEHRQRGERERVSTMLRMGMEVAGIGTWEFDPANSTVVASPATAAIFGLPSDQEPRPLEDYLKAVHPEDAEWVRSGLAEAARERTPLQREYRLLHPDGRTRWIHSKGSFVCLPDGAERMIGALYDVTERKRQEDEREASLRTHQMLLRELNHRIKNNLQVVTGLLQLQAARIDDPSATAQFSRAIDRIQTIADLHAQLGLDGGFGHIEFGSYLREICEKLRRSLLDEGQFELRCHAEEGLLDLDRAVPMGLVVNELITNAAKHAFPQGASGTITVALRRADDESLILSVSDTGAGMPKSGGSRGLGMQLIEGLCRQVGATIEVINDNGFGYVIRVPKEGG